MTRPAQFPPIGLRLTRTARTVSYAFERAMADAGGSASAWQVLLLVRSEQWGTQSRMADAMGITGATLTHHLNALEKRGLLRRWRDDENRRVQHVALTAAGEELFARLREVAVLHDRRLRSNLTEQETAVLVELLDKLQAGVDPAVTGS
jgi:MarR family transcriptional regulator, transcriptional regulator for hemolysin